MRPVMRAAAAAVSLAVSGVLAAIPAAAAPTETEAAPAEAATRAVAATPAGLPAGWSQAAGSLTWVSPRALPLTSAGVQFFSGTTFLGFPARSADGRTYRLAIEPGSYRPADLAVSAAGRRLDVPVTAAAARSVAQAAPTTATTRSARAGVDPGVPGAYATRSGSYRLAPVAMPGLPQPVEMLARVVSPVGAPGARPLVLFLHGRHAICYRPGPRPTLGDQAWPCPAGEKPIPSYLGYLRAQKLLASQGYVTVSVAANGINGQDADLFDGGAQARSSLVRLHLGHWADWSGAGRDSAPGAVRAAPPVNLRKVLLIGHSRGGEGVNRAALDSLNPPPAAVEGYPGSVRWTVGGTFLLAPTAFGQNPAPDVPSVTLLPGCDGDVYDLQGQMYVDASRAGASGTALHSSVHVVGADHNFFNTEWTPKQAVAPANDDWFATDDKLCGTTKKVARTSARLSPVRQQKVGATYVAAAARLFLAGDDRARPLLDGSRVRPASIGKVRVATSAIGLRRVPLALPGGGGARVTDSGATTASLCKQVGPDGARGLCLRPGTNRISPNFTPFVYDGDDPDRRAVKLSWTRAGGRASVAPVAGASDLSGASSVALRLIVPPNSTSTLLDVAVVDAAGRRAVLGRVHPIGLPGTGNTVSYWAQELRVPLAGAGERVDLSRVARLDLTPRSRSGKAWLIDAWGRSPGTPKLRYLSRARVDVGDLAPQPEGDSTRTVRVPLTVTGTGTGRIRVFVRDTHDGKVTSTLTRVPAGRTVEVPIVVPGDTAYSYDSGYDVYAKELTGAVVGEWQGGVTVTDDDPVPVLTATARADGVTEGGRLAWRLTMSAPAEDELTAYLTFVKPASGREISTNDVKASWVRDRLHVKPAPSRALSKAEGTYEVNFPAGKLAGDVTVPTVTDTRDEPTERVRAQVYWLDAPDPVLELTGQVRDG